jgi:hypothetical protein
MGIPEPTPNPGNGWRERLPPLEPGDRLTRAEFERRYEAMPGLRKAELIEGVVHVPSPVRLRRHSQPHGSFSTWLGTYASGTPGITMGDNGTVRLDLDNELQPDSFLLIEPERGGQVRISEDDYVEGAPELVGEVAASTVSIDLGPKLSVYRRNGVREYVVWRVLNQEVDWFALREGQYERLIPNADGLLKSEVFPGLWLDVPALLRGDMAGVLATVQKGLATAEHAAFVEHLALPRTGKNAQD